MNFLSDDDEPFEEFNEDDYGSDADMYDPDADDDNDETTTSKAFTDETTDYLEKSATKTSEMTQLTRAAAISSVRTHNEGQESSLQHSTSSLSSLISAATTSGSSGSGLGNGSGYETLTEEDVERTMEQSAKRVSDIYGISHDDSVIILRRNHWNKDRVIDQLADDPDVIYTSSGLVQPPSEGTLLASSEPTLSGSQPSTPGEPSNTFQCSICGEEVTVSETYSLGCGHRFCNDCWRSYITVSMQENGHLGIVMTQCPGYKCSYPVGDSVFLRYLSPADQAKFRAAGVRQFVQEDAHYKWCPGRGCGRVVHVERAGRLEPVVCGGCGFVYCFQCNDHDVGDHRPSTCAQIRAWNAKAQSETENIKWLTANAKQCPKCHVYIEKNEGCMHMTCRKSSGGCGYEWCWLCRGPWSEHSSKTGGFYACNKYDKSSAKKIDDEASKVKVELDHYMFYFHRYTSHKEAQAKAVEQYKRLPERQKEMLTTFACFGLATSDLSFLYDAAAVIIECRRTLAYSYVYGFYFEKGDKRRELFEFIQEDLEKWTNHLTALFEQKIVAVTDYQKYKEDLTNYSRVASKYLNNFNSNYMGNPQSSSSSL